VRACVCVCVCVGGGSFPDYIYYICNWTQEVFLETNLSNGKKICLYST